MTRLSVFVFGLALACATPPAAPPDASTGAEPVASSSTPARATPGEREGEAGGDRGEGEGEGAVLDPGQRYEIVVGTDACSSDGDCVEAECCHATTCSAAEKAPSCADVACTLDCRVGTTDCYGGCLCQDGKCAARRWLGPADG